jgi:hypothetical protein
VLAKSAYVIGGVPEIVVMFAVTVSVDPAEIGVVTVRMTGVPDIAETGFAVTIRQSAKNANMMKTPSCPFFTMDAISFLPS